MKKSEPGPRTLLRFENLKLKFFGLLILAAIPWLAQGLVASFATRQMMAQTDLWTPEDLERRASAADFSGGKADGAARVEVGNERAGFSSRAPRPSDGDRPHEEGSDRRKAGDRGSDARRVYSGERRLPEQQPRRALRQAGAKRDVRRAEERLPLAGVYPAALGVRKPLSGMAAFASADSRTRRGSGHLPHARGYFRGQFRADPALRIARRFSSILVSYLTAEGAKSRPSGGKAARASRAPESRFRTLISKRPRSSTSRVWPTSSRPAPTRFKAKGSASGSGKPERVDQTLKKYPVGAEVPVFYDPENPKDCVLEREPPVELRLPLGRHDYGVTCLYRASPRGFGADGPSSLTWPTASPSSTMSSASSPPARWAYFASRPAFGIACIRGISRRGSPRKARLSRATSNPIRNHDRSSGRSVRYAAVIEFSYTVDGQEYHGTKGATDVVKVTLEAGRPRRTPKPRAIPWAWPWTSITILKIRARPRSTPIPARRSMEPAPSSSARSLWQWRSTSPGIESFC